MACIDLTVPGEEVCQFDYENRPIWPRVPTPCTVPNCGPVEYTNFKTFITHWNKVHQSTKLVYVCSCKRRFATRKHINCHLKTEKGHTESDSQKLQNPEFRDPGDNLPYQYGTLSDRTLMKEVQKHQASKRRRAEADKFKDIRPILCSGSHKNVCRDEIVKERGGKLVKDTNLWDNPKRRRRVDFK